MKNKKYLLSAAVAICIVVIALVGYSIIFKGATEEKPKTPIKIAVIFPLTGGFARHGLSIWEGVKYMVDKINAKGGIDGHTIEMITYDDTSSATVGCTLFEKAIYKDEVLCIIGGYGSAIAGAECPVAENGKTPFLPLGSVDIKMMQQGYKYVFRIPPDAYACGIEPAKFILYIYQKRDPTIKRIWLSGTTSSRASLDQVSVVENMTKAAGLEVMREDFQTGITDVHPIVERMKAFNPDVVHFVHYYEESVLLAKTILELGVKPKMILGAWGMGQLEFMDFFGPLIEYWFAGVVWSPDSTYDGSQEFVNDFSREWGHLPDYHQAYGVAGVMVLEAAVKNLISNGKELTRDNLMLALEQVEIDTPLCAVKFSKTPNEHPLGELHQNLLARTVAVQIRNGTWVTFWPPEASANPEGFIYPIPWK